jgi:glutamate-5-semialdehyde dehydrogenase
MRQLAEAARDAARVVGSLPRAEKDAVLLDVAAALAAQERELLEASARDVAAAEASGLSRAKLARLALSGNGLAQMAEGLRQIAAMEDPIGAVTRHSRTPAGLDVRKVRAPLGVIAMIYEARPGVTIDAFALCFKAGNACILKGGKEAAHANAALASIVHRALKARGLPEGAAAVESTLGRDQLRELLTCEDCIDLVIPRGGVELIRFVHEHSRIPTVQHFQGVCHIFVDASADVERAVEVCVNAKTSAPATCNAAECVLVHRAIASEFVPRLVAAMASRGVEVRGDGAVRALAPEAIAAQEADFGAEFLDLILACRVVEELDEAIAHIHRFGSNHTEAILTREEGNARVFTERVRSSCVIVNASTRFNDGFQLGLGAEIGISTSRVHAYGPMGLEELTTQRWIVQGRYDVR